VVNMAAFFVASHKGVQRIGGQRGEHDLTVARMDACRHSQALGRITWIYIVQYNEMRGTTVPPQSGKHVIAQCRAKSGASWWVVRRFQSRDTVTTNRWQAASNGTKAGGHRPATLGANSASTVPRCRWPAGVILLRRYPAATTG